MKKLILFLIVLVVLFGMWGYGNVGGACVDDRDCGDEEYCLGNVCKERPFACANDNDCLPNQFCQAGICANWTEEICDNLLDDDNDNLRDCDDPDCGGQFGPEGVICCQSDENCSGEYTCQNYICVQKIVTQNLIFEDCTNGIDDDGDGLFDCEDDECWDKEFCAGDFCEEETDKIVVWSYILPSEQEKKDNNELPMNYNCCLGNQCTILYTGVVYGQRCLDYDSLKQERAVCGMDNNWIYCGEDFPEFSGQFSDSGNYYCNGSKWIGVEINCSNSIDDNNWGGIDCDDPTCDKRDRCEYGKELTCNDGFDNDQDAPLTFVPVGGAIYQPVLDETNEESWWDNLKRILWGRKEAVAGKGGFGGIGINEPEYGIVSPEPKITMKEICNDSLDNDGDGAVDCDDTDCADAPACPHLGVGEISPYEPRPGFEPEFKPSQGGTDCLDSDCWGEIGPHNHACCFTASDCPGAGAECVNNECKETSCSNNLDDDGDGKIDCQDSNCAKKKCKGITGEDWRCVEKECKEIPKWMVGVEVEKPIQIFSYRDISRIFNKCKIREGEGNNCADICEVGETGFPTKWEDDKILRCTCC